MLLAAKLHLFSDVWKLKLTKVNHRRREIRRKRGGMEIESLHRLTQVTDEIEAPAGRGSSSATTWYEPAIYHDLSDYGAGAGLLVDHTVRRVRRIRLGARRRAHHPGA
jgi:hypothetical protein